MMNSIKPTARKNNILVQEVVGETMVYDLEINKAYLLNTTSSLVWQLSDGTNSISEIADSISAELDAKVSEDLVMMALDQFRNDGLLEKDELSVSFFGNLSRREIVKRIGLSTMVALPLVSPIVVPNSAQGASCIPDNLLCAVPADCCSNCCPDASDGASICNPLQPNGTCPPIN